MTKASRRFKPSPLLNRLIPVVLILLLLLLGAVIVIVGLSMVGVTPGA